MPAVVGGYRGAASWEEKFMRFNPPQYKGFNILEEEEFWIQEIEQLFRLLECPD